MEISSVVINSSQFPSSVYFFIVDENKISASNLNCKAGLSDEANYATEPDMAILTMKVKVLPAQSCWTIN